MNTKTYIRTAAIKAVSRIKNVTAVLIIFSTVTAAVFSGINTLSSVKASASELQELQSSPSLFVFLEQNDSLVPEEYTEKPSLTEYLEKPESLKKLEINADLFEYADATGYQKLCISNFLSSRSADITVSGVMLVDYMDENEAAEYRRIAEEKAKEEELRLLAEEAKKRASSSAPSMTFNADMVKDLSEDEIEMLCRIVEAEATGEKIIGKILVANVVLNRVNNKSFPNSVEGVIFQHSGRYYQFSPLMDGRYYTVPITETTREAVSRALAGEDYSKGSLYFFERARTSEERAAWFDTLTFKLQYGCHEFFR